MPQASVRVQQEEVRQFSLDPCGFPSNSPGSSVLGPSFCSYLHSTWCFRPAQPSSRCSLSLEWNVLLVLLFIPSDSTQEWSPSGRVPQPSRPSSTLPQHLACLPLAVRVTLKLPAWGPASLLVCHQLLRGLRLWTSVCSPGLSPLQGHRECLLLCSKAVVALVILCGLWIQGK